VVLHHLVDIEIGHPVAVSQTECLTIE
jgi:hypothetical protein